MYGSREEVVFIKQLGVLVIILNVIVSDYFEALVDLLLHVVFFIRKCKFGLSLRVS